MFERLAVTAATLVAAAGLAVPAATAAPHLLIGVYDEGETFYGDPNQVFPLYQTLGVQVLRVSLYWGGPLGAANKKPAKARDPGDPAYHWEVYDRTVRFAQVAGIKILFSIYGTPRWANGGKGLNHAPRRPIDLRNFAYAAAKRYSGTFPASDGTMLPPVRLWTAWNEPNNPAYLRPQFARTGKSAKPFRVQSAIDYAKICNAVYSGVHSTLLRAEKVACGVTAPRGNNNPHSSRPSISPVAFLNAAKKAGMKTFDAYAHHPYYGVPAETPFAKPPPTKTGQSPTAVTLANLDVLLKRLSLLYGARKLWITEYGYQTKPPDPRFGVSWKLQARYLAQAYRIARKNPRIAMMLWFLVRDEPDLGGWQSGLMTVDGKKKPAFNAFRKLPR